MSRQIRACWGIDGEGRDIAGRHRYVYLCAFDRQRGKVYDIRNYETGLDTETCLAFLVNLPHKSTDIVAGFFFGYDTTMALADLTNEQKTTLHRAGFVVWQAPQSGMPYYIEYHPSKSLFVGTLERPLAKGERPDLSTWRWRGSRRWVHIEDVGSYSQTSFVETLRTWAIADESLLDFVQSMKVKRGAFEQESPEEIERYCLMECALLARYVATVQSAVVSEGIQPRGWHGPGAIGTALLRREKMGRYLADPTDPNALSAVMASYFGGRADNSVVGLVSRVYTTDLRSAYPAALAGCLPDTPGLPDLVGGTWHLTRPYDRGLPWAVWHVRWSIPAVPEHYLPFPYRAHQKIWYPSRGAGWYHASLVRAALEQFPRWIDVTEGWVYEPDDTTARPWAFVGELARKRVEYKLGHDPRERVLKLALNSLYGKLAQHAIIAGRNPPFRCYYAAGYVTAATQAELFRQVYRGGHDGSTVVGVATDGLFTTAPRVERGGAGLGEWEQGEPLDDVYVIQPGVYYASDGRVRTRGFAKASLSYEGISRAWQRDGISAVASYAERRFIGLGYCSGTGDFGDYGQWRECDREVVFYPDKPVLGDGPSDWYRLGSVAMYGESEAYEPANPLATDLGYAQVDGLLAEWWRHDQP